MNNPLYDRALQVQSNGIPLPVYAKISPRNKPLPGTKFLPETRYNRQHLHPPRQDDDEQAGVLNPARLPHGRMMPPGSQAQADKPHPEAWQRAPMGMDRSEYSSAELDHPVSKLGRVNAKGEEWRSRIELWIENVPIPDLKVRAAMLKEMSGLGEEVHRKSKKTNGLDLSLKGMAAGTKEDPVIIID